MSRYFQAKTVFTCDRCGAFEAVSQNTGVPPMSWGQVSSYSIDPATRDLCPRCMAAFKDFLLPVPAPVRVRREART